MSLQTSVWRIEGVVPRPVRPSPMDLEERLEDLIVADPDLLGPDQLLVVDQQVVTSHGKRLDVLALDEEARLHAIELKKDRTPRDVVAQALDYGWWIRNLTLDDVREIWRTRRIDDDVDTEEISLDDAYYDRFQVALDPETFNLEHRLTVVAASLDQDTPRILEYLADDYDVPVNAVLFSHFQDDGREYLTRTWLRPPTEDDTKSAPKRAHRGQKQTWNGRDVFIPLGSHGRETGDRWKPCLKYGFVGAGGGRTYSSFLERLQPGMRAFGYVGGVGYVGVGEVLAPVMPLRDFRIEVDGEQRRVIDLPDCPEWMRQGALVEDPDLTEYAVPVEWLETRGLDDAFKETGLRAQQLPCRLKDQHTIDRVEAEFGLAEPAFSDLPAVDRLERVSDDVRALFDQVEALCIRHGLERRTAKWWVNFVNAEDRPVVGIVVRKANLKAYVDHDPKDLAAAGYTIRDVSEVAHHGSGNTEITIASSTDVEALAQVLKASL